MTQTPTAAEEALANATNEASLARSIARSAEIEADIAVNPGRYRMFTGVRPTGNMHLGHYFGTMHSWKTIQDAGVETWILVADYQVITDRDGVGPIRERVLSLVTDALAVGVDPQRSTIFAHSAVPAQNQLMLPFLSLVTESELHRNPTVKSELEATDGRAMSGLRPGSSPSASTSATGGPSRTTRSSAVPRPCSARPRCCWAWTGRR